MKRLKSYIAKLTVVYMTVMCLIILITGVMTYIIVNFSLEAYGERMYQEVAKTETLINNPETAKHVADTLIDEELDRLRNYIFIFSGVAAIIAPFLAYYLARKYIEPAIRAQERQRQFISNAAHELRTPLAVVTGELDLALRQPRLAEEYRVAIENSRNGILEINNLIGQLLLLGQLDEIKEVDKKEVDIYLLIQKLVKDKAKAFESRGLRLDISIHANVRVSVNSDLFNIAIMNLLDNVIKYALPDSTVKIDVNFGSAIQIIISNQTEYTPSDYEMKHLSERFYRPNSSKSKGFGLGLAISRTIIEKHSGMLSIAVQDNRFTTKITFKATYN